MIANGILVFCCTGCRQEATVIAGGLYFCDAHKPRKVTLSDEELAEAWQRGVSAADRLAEGAA